jgi:hypothetical protein
LDGDALAREMPALKAVFSERPELGGSLPTLSFLSRGNG